MWAEGGFSEYLPWAIGKDADAKPMPLWIKPKQKLSVADLQNSMRDHYENTPLSLTQDDDLGQGIFSAPYRLSPLSYDVDGKKYFNERPISTQQSAFVFVSQLRSWLPRQVGGVFWFGNDDANMVAFTPIYCSMTERPACYNTPNADAVTFSMDNAYWVCNWVSNMVYPRYNALFPALKARRDKLDSQYLSMQKEIEQKAMAVYMDKGEEACARFLNEYSVQMAQEMLAEWQQLATYIIVKYNDMVEKPEADGKFKLSPYGLGETVKRPGYSPAARRAIADRVGERLAMPE